MNVVKNVEKTGQEGLEEGGPGGSRAKGHRRIISFHSRHSARSKTNIQNLGQPNQTEMAKIKFPKS